jgi:hypothetical protein
MTNPEDSRGEHATWRGWAAVVFCFFAAIEGFSAFYRMFSGFKPWDDEGYFMITVKQFLDGHSLYSQVFSQYGPFYYLYEWVLFHVIRTPVSHDSVRCLALLAWLVIPLISAWSVHHVTRSIPLGVAAQLAVFQLFGLLSWEPGHPTELTEILVAAGMLLMLYVERDDQRRWVLPCLGAIVASMMLTKINVGGLFGIAVGLGLLAHTRRSRLMQVVWNASLLAAVILPFVLTHRLASQAWARNFAIVVALSFSAVVLSIYKKSSDAFYLRGFAVFLLSAAGSGLLIFLFVRMNGTSLGMLLEGLLIAPWHSVGAFVFPTVISSTDVLLAATAVPLAAAYSMESRDDERGMTWLKISAPWLKGAFGAVMLLAVLLSGSSLLNSTHWLIAHGTPFVFLVLLPEPMGGSPKLPFWRVAWCLVAMFQILQTYPVAGSDAAAAVYPMLLVAAICVDDFLKYLPFVLPQTESKFVGRFNFSAVLLIVALFSIRDYFVQRAQYLQNVPLDLPGAVWIRLPSEQASQYQQITSWIKTSADTFVTLPGMYSFYFWAQVDPPTCRNVTHWMTLLPETDQRQIVRVLGQHPHAAVIYSPEMAAFWHRPENLPQRTPSPLLVNYIFEHFEKVKLLPATSQLEFASSYRLMLWRRASPGVLITSHDVTTPCPKARL